MIENPWFYPVAVIAVLIFGISKSGFGSGLGALAVPMMALVISPPKAAAIMLPVLCVIDLFNILHYRSNFDRENLKVLLPAAFIGILLGFWYFRLLSDDHIRVMIGVLAIIFVLNYLLKRGNPKRQAPNKIRGSIFGALTGFISFGIHSGGLPLSAYLLPQQMKKSTFVGTTVVFLMIINYVKLVPYYFLGQLNGDNLLTSLLLVPLAPVGVWIGIRLHNRLNETLFYRLCYSFLFIAGIKLLYDGILGLV